MPSAAPKAATRAVTLGNIGVLLKIFPKKPFYLTEYGLSTGVTDLFCVTVSPADQARYLRQAFALASRRPQIKVLLWFLVKDFVQDPQNGDGVYSGLVTPGDVRKPAWFAFAQGNALTVSAPSSAASGARVRRHRRPHDPPRAA